MAPQTLPDTKPLFSRFIKKSLGMKSVVGVVHFDSNGMNTKSWKAVQFQSTSPRKSTVPWAPAQRAKWSVPEALASGLGCLHVS